MQGKGSSSQFRLQKFQATVTTKWMRHKQGEASITMNTSQEASSHACGMVPGVNHPKTSRLSSLE